MPVLTLAMVFSLISRSGSPEPVSIFVPFIATPALPPLLLEAPVIEFLLISKAFPHWTMIDTGHQVPWPTRVLFSTLTRAPVGCHFSSLWYQSTKTANLLAAIVLCVIVRFPCTLATTIPLRWISLKVQLDTVKCRRFRV